MDGTREQNKQNSNWDGAVTEQANTSLVWARLNYYVSDM